MAAPSRMSGGRPISSEVRGAPSRGRVDEGRRDDRRVGGAGGDYQPPPLVMKSFR
jgi:hypothetical protein